MRWVVVEVLLNERLQLSDLALLFLLVDIILDRLVLLPGVKGHKLVLKELVSEVELEWVHLHHCVLLLVHPENSCLEVTSLAEQELKQFILRVDVLAWIVVVINARPFKVERATKSNKYEIRFETKPILTRTSVSSADRTCHIRWDDQLSRTPSSCAAFASARLSAPLATPDHRHLCLLPLPGGWPAAARLWRLRHFYFSAFGCACWESWPLTWACGEGSYASSSPCRSQDGPQGALDCSSLHRTNPGSVWST